MHYKLILISALAVASVPALAMPVLALPVLGTNQVNGYNVNNCVVDNDPFFTYNYCTNSATKAYSKYGTAENINFNGKYTVIVFKKKKTVETGYRWYGHYVVVDPQTKEVYPFPFAVSKIDGSKDFNSIVSKSSDKICFLPSYSLSGNALLGELGGVSSQQGKKLCFKFDPSYEYNFDLMPTVEIL